MVIAVQDEASRFSRMTITYLRRIGISSRHLRFGFRGSFAAVGIVRRRRKIYWIKQKSNKRRRGPSVIFTRIPIGGKFITHVHTIIYKLSFR